MMFDNSVSGLYGKIEEFCKTLYTNKVKPKCHNDKLIIEIVTRKKGS